MAMNQYRCQTVILLLIIPLLLIGCGEAKEKPSSKTQKIVSQKIEVKPEENNTSDQKEMTSSSLTPDLIKEKGVLEESDSKESETASLNAMNIQESSQSSDKAIIEEDKNISPVFLEAQKRQESLRVVYGYSPIGKIDPFQPLFKKEVKKEPLVRSKTVNREKKTELEMVDLAQLKLVATLIAPSGNRAMIEDATGKGYIVRLGTYIGLNSGRIIEISKNGLVVEEREDTVFGNTQIQKRELKLQKPPGE